MGVATFSLYQEYNGGAVFTGGQGYPKHKSEPKSKGLLHQFIDFGISGAGILIYEAFNGDDVRDIGVSSDYMRQSGCIIESLVTRLWPSASPFLLRSTPRHYPEMMGKIY